MLIGAASFALHHISKVLVELFHKLAGLVRLMSASWQDSDAHSKQHPRSGYFFLSVSPMDLKWGLLAPRPHFVILFSLFTIHSYSRPHVDIEIKTKAAPIGADWSGFRFGYTAYRKFAGS